jgi:hypothetical protein
MRSKAKLLSSIAALGAFVSMGAFAQELTTPPPASTSASAPVTPSRGASMEDVKAKFGAPSQEVPSIGQPPITRWEYPGYVVFFENDKVLHTVVVRS